MPERKEGVNTHSPLAGPQYTYLATRGRCLNCGTLFKIPVCATDKKFCKDSCRAEFHRNGGISFTRHKNLLEMLVRKKLADIGRDIKLLAERIERLERPRPPRRRRRKQAAARRA